MVTQEEVLQKFKYVDGSLIWRKNGKIAGCLDKSNGYMRCSVGKKNYYIHHLIFLMKNGYTPENYIDHINMNRIDNRIENLREVSASCNIRNSTRASKVSGFRGVYPSHYGLYNRWRSEVFYNKKRYYLGTYDSIEEAYLSRVTVEDCLGIGDCRNALARLQFKLEGKK